MIRTATSSPSPEGDRAMPAGCWGLVGADSTNLPFTRIVVALSGWRNGPVSAERDPDCVNWHRSSEVVLWPAKRHSRQRGKTRRSRHSKSALWHWSATRDGRRACLRYGLRRPSAVAVHCTGCWNHCSNNSLFDLALYVRGHRPCNSIDCKVLTCQMNGSTLRTISTLDV